MGLDMYIYNRKYVRNSWNNNCDVTVTITGKDYDSNTKSFTPFEEKHKNVVYLIQEVGYWRKANAIHKWFVDNVCDGKNDCNPYYFNINKLQKLKDTCQSVLDNHDLAPTLLPTYQGCFYGTYDYDEYYFDNLKDTIKIIDNIIDNYDSYNDALYYEASW